MSLKLKSVTQMVDIVENEQVNFRKIPQVNGINYNTGSFSGSFTGGTFSGSAVYANAVTASVLSSSAHLTLYSPNNIYLSSSRIDMYSNLEPDTDAIRNLGKSNYRWANVYTVDITSSLMNLTPTAGSRAGLGSYLALNTDNQIITTSSFIERQELDDSSPLGDNASRPRALYNFNGNLTDESFVGENLSSSSGTELYYPNLLFSGSQSFYLNGSTQLTSSHNSGHQITGEMTVMMVVNLVSASAWVDGEKYLMSYGASSETLAKNILYSYTLQDGVPVYKAEKDGGDDITYTLTNYDFPYNQWVFTGFTRTDLVIGPTTYNIIQFYLNGDPWGPSSTTLAAANGGTDGYLGVGGWVAGGNNVKGQIKTLKILPVGLTNVEWMDEFERVTGDFKFL